ncbi:hypothetical protein Afil01_22970 [Actinorhabdospora filicis]|uniref:Uncharacterized protein n=1 Tax=Actinorhabdospora filicis TaxID=1785913 RepID=A0A9W6SKB0_9ACTN|nr:DUF5825 family protein [Actinorhabdospora filicis]GLZ77490.1 hypothetical protein Afil01_22970 [Actinorhabdospora filicis]
MPEPIHATTARTMHAGAPEKTVRVPGVIDFDTDPPRETAQFIRLLRDAAAEGTDVHWTGRGNDPELTRKLTHLPPPSEPLHPSVTAPWRDWTASYRLGVLYRRTGPGFLIVQDRRPFRQKPARIVIGDPHLRSVLERCDEPADLRTGGIGKAAGFLAGSDLVLILGDWVVTLPYRLAGWPVPAYSV